MLPLMRVAITGSTGLIGTSLGRALEARGDDVLRFVRRPPRSPDELFWNPADHVLDPGSLEGIDAIVHLAGENVAGGRWTEARKAAILGSRVDGTRTLVDAIAAAKRRPAVLVSASAIGIYGDRGDEPLDEESPPGEGFLAEVCVAWEREASRASSVGVRVARARIGIVLAAEGGALEKMRTPFSLGVGGKLGDGRHWMSWVHLEDVVAMILLALDDERVVGPFNAVAPAPARNTDFTAALGAALRRPTFLPVPRFAVRAAFGRELVDEALLASAKVLPERLRSWGFAWRYPELQPALEACLRK